MGELRSDPAVIVQALTALLEPGQVAEVRILGARKGTSTWTENLTGYFDTDHLAELAKEVGAVTATGCYFTLNPVNPDLQARAFNRLRKAEKGDSTGDKDIVCRRLFLIDLDAVRPTGISSTKAEKDAAWDTASMIRDWLTFQGWPDPVVIDSGNGFHLIYRVALPTDDAGTTHRCLQALAKRFDDGAGIVPAVHVDLTVANPARISKLPGTPVRKGDNAPTRPHRMAGLVTVPEVFEVVSSDLLEALAGPVEAKVSSKVAPRTHFNLASFMSRHFPDASGPAQKDDGQWYEIACPWRPSDGKSAHVVQFSSGALDARCQHATCPGSSSTGNHWRELRDMFEPAPAALTLPNDPGGDLWQADPHRAAPATKAGGSAPAVGTPGPVRLLDSSAWSEIEPPPLRYLLDGLLPLGAPAILAAKSNAGKSMIGMQISFAIAAGRGLFGRRGLDVPQKVLFVEMEDDPGEIQRRYRRCLDLFREDQDWGPVQEANLKANWRAVVPEWTSTGARSLTGILPHLQAHAAQLCQAGGQVALVILDTFAALSEGEENKAEVQQAFWASCYSLAASTGGTPLVVHHVRKLGPTQSGKNAPGMAERLSFDSLRGSTAIVAGARAILQAEPLTPEEATRLNLDEERAAAGNFIVLALTKNNAGPKGAWLALEQREVGENGAGFFTSMRGGDLVCASLRSKAAVARLSLSEAVLLSIADGCQDRKELAKKHWPEKTEAEASSTLKTMVSHLRTRHGWLQKGRGFDLTVSGFSKVQELRGKHGTHGGDFERAETEENLAGTDSIKVSIGDFDGYLAPTGTEPGSPAEPQGRLAPPVPGLKVSKSPNPRRGKPGDLETLGEVI